MDYEFSAGWVEIRSSAKTIHVCFLVGDREEPCHTKQLPVSLLGVPSTTEPTQLERAFSDKSYKQIFKSCKVTITKRIPRINGLWMSYIEFYPGRAVCKRETLYRFRLLYSCVLYSEKGCLRSRGDSPAW